MTTNSLVVTKVILPIDTDQLILIDQTLPLACETYLFILNQKKMIKEVTGDILLTECKTIAHSVAPMDHFDSGLALSLREMYPSMTKDFRHYCKVYHPKPGTIWSWGGIGGRQIVNLMAQEPAPSEKGGHPGKASMSNLDHCLKELAKWIEAEKVDQIALPKLATGVGGLDWKDVEPSIQKHLGDLGIPVYVYTTYAKGVKAEES